MSRTLHGTGINVPKFWDSGTCSLAPPGSILSVESNQNVESKTKNVESKTEKCGVQNSILTSRKQLF